MVLGTGSRLMYVRVGGLPKKTETFYFFQIDPHRVHDFRTKLTQLIPHIKSTAQVVDDRKKLAQNKKDAADKKHPPPIIKLSGLNIAFTHKGLVQVKSLLAATEHLKKLISHGFDRWESKMTSATLPSVQACWLLLKTLEMYAQPKACF